jgi:hypothetical protein
MADSGSATELDEGEVDAAALDWAGREEVELVVVALDPQADRTAAAARIPAMAECLMRLRWNKNRLL